MEAFPEIEPFDYNAYFEENIVFLYFHLTRKREDSDIDILSNTLSDVLGMLHKEMKKDGVTDKVNAFASTNQNEKHENNSTKKEGVAGFPQVPWFPAKQKEDLRRYYNILFRMIGDTRSIISDEQGCGKGENELAYMMIYEWYLHFPKAALAAAKACFYKHGSWRDFPYLCNYVFRKTSNKFHSLIEHCIDMANTQLAADLETWKFSVNCFSRDHISTVAKWIPRENKQFDWLHHRCVLNWAKKKFPHILDSALTDESYEKAVFKCNRFYRKTFATLNKALDTTQIKQCSQNIDKIDPKMVSPITAMKQARTLRVEGNGGNGSEGIRIRHEGNVGKGNNVEEGGIRVRHGPEGNVGNEGNGGIRVRPEVVGGNVEEGDKEVFKGTRSVMPLSYYIKEAYALLENPLDNDRVERLNQEWAAYSANISNDGFHNTLPMIDVSSSMYEYSGESYYTAIGLALLISERSSLSDRIMAYGIQPEWIILEKDATFFDKVKTIRQSIRPIQWCQSDLIKALELVHSHVATAQKENPAVVFSKTLGSNRIKHPILVIISDSFAGVADYQMPIQQRVIYWNVSTHMNTQLPCKYNQRNCIIMSGLCGGLLSNFKRLKRYSRNRAFMPFDFLTSPVPCNA